MKTTKGSQHPHWGHTANLWGQMVHPLGSHGFLWAHGFPLGSSGARVNPGFENWRVIRKLCATDLICSGIVEKFQDLSVLLSQFLICDSLSFQYLCDNCLVSSFGGQSLNFAYNFVNIISKTFDLFNFPVLHLTLIPPRHTSSYLTPLDLDLEGWNRPHPTVYWLCFD